MRRIASITSVFVLVLGTLSPCTVPARSANLEYTDSAAPRQIRWRNRTIKLAFSSALNNPGSGIKLGTDVPAAARRAIQRWSSMADVKFIISETTVQSVSPGTGGDGINLVTIADTPQNNSLFAGRAMTGRTRIFYDQDTGAIAEADVVINPHPISAEGVPVQFSDDGTAGTYDLESTFTHEIGHLLGLEHSPVVSSTMHEHQALNGLQGRKAFTERTLSEDDRAQLRNIYGAGVNVGAIEGRVLKQSLGAQTPLEGIQVWAEENDTGRLVTSAISSSDGTFRLDNLNPNDYRLWTSFGMSKVVSATEGKENQTSPIGVAANETREFNVVVPAQQVANAFLNPRLVGTNGELSATPVSAEPGKKLTVLVAGEGLDQVAPNGVSISSRFFSVQQETLKSEPFSSSVPVISFSVTVAPNARFGDYTIRLQSTSGQVVYVPGAITIDPGVESTFTNSADDPRFFIQQHYRDFLGREADASGLEYWADQLEQCGDDRKCQSARRVNVAAAFFEEGEFQRKNVFIYELYRLALGRRPTFSEFSVDRDTLSALSSRGDEGRLMFVNALTERPEFVKRFPLALTPKQFVDTMISSVWKTSQVDLSSDSANLIALFEGSGLGRAAVIRRITETAELTRAEHDGAVVLMQYFGYLMRDPVDEDYTSWLDKLSRSEERGAGRYNRMICSFLSSSEYQSRFGMVITHSADECR